MENLNVWEPRCVTANTLTVVWKNLLATKLNLNFYFLDAQMLRRYVSSREYVCDNYWCAPKS